MNQGYVDIRSKTRNKDRGKVEVLPDHGWNSEKAIPSSRGGDLANISMVYGELRGKLCGHGDLFEDIDFPAKNSSLYYSREPSQEIKWLRPHEICSDPQFIAEGASRLDMRQGEIGDCWLLAAIASFSLDEELKRQVVLPGQDFGSNYRGIFHFKIWHFGDWREVCIDDRLPTYEGRLLYLQSTKKNEFWAVLLEKAYAKLFGSYEALIGGSLSEALVDFTGGICERFDMRKKELPDLLSIMLKSQERRSLMNCAIYKDSSRIPNGLLTNHAYSITAVKQFTLSSGQLVNLVRILDPHGVETEWTGDWSEKSPKWAELPCVNDSKVDGEFWMSYEEFAREFQSLQICHLGPQSFADQGDQPGRKWELCIKHGRWTKGATAGGCSNYIETFANNPQFKIKIVDPNEDDDKNMGIVIVGLMQKDRRARRKEGVALLTIGYEIFKVPKGFSGVANKIFFKKNDPVAVSDTFKKSRELCYRHKLEPGEYIIVPSTFRPNKSGRFLLRIFTERLNEVNEANDAQGIDTDKNMTSALDQGEEQKLEENFNKLKSDTDQIDAEILCKLLSETYTQTKNSAGFPLETCRSMVAMMDVDRSGKLDCDEFKILWDNLKRWQETFTKFDADKSGTMNSMELRAALKAIGFSVNNCILETIVLRYANADGILTFTDFITCCVRLRTLVDIHKAAEKDQGGNLTFNEQQAYLKTTKHPLASIVVVSGNRK